VIKGLTTSVSEGVAEHSGGGEPTHETQNPVRHLRISEEPKTKTTIKTDATSTLFSVIVSSEIGSDRT